MFEYEFYVPEQYTPRPRVTEPVPADFLPLDAIAAVRSLTWGEHCLECSAPECYSTCPLYEARPDGNCRRLTFGMRDADDFQGAPMHAEMQYQRWGKVQGIVGQTVDAPDAAVATDVRQRAQVYAPPTKAKSLKQVMLPVYRLVHSVAGGRKGAPIAEGGTGDGKQPATATPYFLLQAYSHDDAPFGFLVEVTADEVVVSRQRIVLNPGYNQSVFDISDGMSADGRLRIRMYPENDLHARLTFLFAGAVQFTPEALESTVAEALTPAESQGVASEAPAQGAPAAKVKCVAWDLDNTMWDGVLIESDPESLQLRPHVLDVMRALDERGIIQVVVSKNSQSDVVPVLDRLGVSEYLVRTYASWGPKSQSLAQAAKSLNINVDTFALIDDSPFERGEVEYHLPMVRVYEDTIAIPADPADAATAPLFSLPEFDVQVTADGRKRREMYQTEAQREQVMEEMHGDRAEFLRHAGMTLTLAEPRSEAERTRAFELLHRTNQLNLAAGNYEHDAFMASLDSGEGISLVGSCADRFGTYGLVLFLHAHTEDDTLVIDQFAMSCRVAQKMVEPALVKALLDRFGPGEAPRLEMRGRRTERNSLLLNSFKDAGLREQPGESLVLSLDAAADLQNADVVDVVWDD